jgi:hypothetical protein
MVTTTGKTILLAMMLEAKERLQLSWMLPTRSDSTHLSDRWDQNIGWGWHPADQKISDAVNEKGTHAQVCDDFDMHFIVCEFNLYSDDDAHVCRKSSATEPSKKTIKSVTASQTAPSIITTLIPLPAGVTGSTMMSLLRLGTIVDGRLNSWNAWRTGRPIGNVTLFFPYYFFLSISFADSWLSWFAVLAEELTAAQKVLSIEKYARSAANQALAEERAVRQAVE